MVPMASSFFPSASTQIKNTSKSAHTHTDTHTHIHTHKDSHELKNHAHGPVGRQEAYGSNGWPLVPLSIHIIARDVVALQTNLTHGVGAVHDLIAVALKRV